MPLNLEEFDKLKQEFVLTQSITTRNERYCTDIDISKHVMNKLRVYLFEDQITRELRRAQYEELKKEFESN